MPSAVIRDARQNPLNPCVGVGVAPSATLHAVKVFDAAGQETDISVIAGLDWVGTHAESLGIRVVNLSFYRDATPDDTVVPLTGLRAAVAALHAQGLTVAAAAGDNLRHVVYEAPAGYPEVLAVAGTSAATGRRAAAAARCRGSSSRTRKRI